MPVLVTESYEPVYTYEWKEYLKLSHCRDHRAGVSYSFAYAQNRTPDFVTMQGPPCALQSLTGQYTQYLKLKIWVDQTGSIRVLSTTDGRPVKVLEYDAFGNITHETRSGWHFPLGFAGGLNDAYTGFVRFGFRDYDPLVGRFTAKDPIGDTGGDHDLWDYCVDDPINRIDPLGQHWIISALKKVGWGALGSSNNPPKLNAPEELIDIKVKIYTILDKLNDKKANDDDIENLYELRRKELKLEKQWRGHFGNDLSEYSTG